MLSEKHSELSLYKLLEKEKFNNLYYSPNEHTDLKYILDGCSKRGSGIGIPDRIYYDSNILILFECKKDKLSNAKKDLNIYFKNLKLDKFKLIIFGVAYISELEYEIYRVDVDRNCNIIKNKILQLSTFGINITKNNIDMKSKISKIHNYIYQNTKISNEDKPLFMAIILIGLKNNILVEVIDNIVNKNNIYSLLESILTTYDISINIFNQLSNSNDLDHLYNLILMVNSIYKKYPSIDLLNELYSEFIKYGNTDSKSLGIVLTPSHIVSIMCKILNINSSDTVLDLCTGTGSFLLEASKYNPCKLIGCEYQNKLFNLLKCNLIIRDITNYNIINEDCFNNKFKATKSIINPPYATNINEWEFILKQINSIEDDGECCAIVPNSIILNNISNNKYKKQVLEIANILNIIICRNTLFYPVANISTVIIHLKKKINNTKSLTKIIDYRDDGYESKRSKGWIKGDLFNDKLNKLYSDIKNNNGIELLFNEDWYHLSIDSNYSINKSNLQTSLLQIEYFDKLLYLEDIIISNPNIEREVDIDTYFNILTKPTIEYKKTNKVLCIAAKNNNNGVKNITNPDKNTFEGNKLCIVISGDGGAGMCYYQYNDFSICSAVKVLDPKDNIKLDKYIGIYISEQLLKNKSIYNRGYTWTISRIKQTKFKLPFKNNNIDYEYIKSLYI
jgi:type I restriction-modification system DNA methylase subunit